jgi:hypothetical protein
MSDITIMVTFNQNATPQFVFDPPGPSMMNAAGKLIFMRKAVRPPATWNFVSANVQNDLLGEFSSALQGNGTSLQLNDAFRDVVTTSYCYTITVTNGTMNWTSPDPVIVNQPETPKGSPKPNPAPPPSPAPKP